MRINNNIMSMNAHRQLNINNNNGAKSMERLSSGMRINRAGDDAAGLSISEKMRGQIRGLNQASRNAQDGISLIQTAEGALNETHAILQRMRELAVQAGNGTNEPDDLTAIQDEITALNTEITAIADRTQFNGKTLLDGSFNGKPTEDKDTAGVGVGTDAADQKIQFQIGANGGQQVDLIMANMSAEQLGGTNKISAIDVKAATFDVDTVLVSIDEAIGEVSTQRSSLGALQNRLEHTIANLDNGKENLQAAESRIRDVDMAAEMMEFTKNNILSQAATAMMAQANAQPQSVLQLLG